VVGAGAVVVVGAGAVVTFWVDSVLVDSLPGLYGNIAFVCVLILVMVKPSVVVGGWLDQVTLRELSMIL